MCMITTLIKGIDDNVKIEIPGSVYLVCAIMEIGRAENPLTFEVRLKGKELLKLLNKARVPNVSRFNIKDDNRYEVIAFDC